MATKARSPNYPQISLQKAIELADKLYSKAHTNKGSAAMVAAALGYTGLNGASLGVISALKKYGLIETVGDNEFKISKDGLSILVDPKGSQERAGAIIRAAYRPALFRELRQEYGDKPPPADDFLRAFLLKRGFVQGIVDTPIRTYRDTMKLVQEVQGAFEDDDVEPADEVSDEEPEMSDINSQPALEKSSPSGQPPASPLPSAAMPHHLELDALDDTYRLPDGRAFVLRWPSTITVDEYEDFEAWITLLQRKLKRAIQQ